MAALFGISAEALPEDWTGFLQYNRKMFASPSSLDAALLPSSQCNVRRRHMIRHRTGSCLDPTDAAAASHSFCIAIRAREEAVQWPGAGYPALSFIRRVTLVGPFTSQRPLRGRAPDSSPARALFLDGQSRLG